MPPSWVIGLLGALIVLVSTFLLSIRVTTVDEEILKSQERQAELSASIETKWDNHKLADSREARADQLVGLALLATSTETQGRLIDAASGYLIGAVLAMDLAAQNRMSEDEVMTLDYNGRKAILDKLRLESKDAIDAVAIDRRKVEQEINEKRSRRGRLRMWAVALNLLGVAVVMLKDLPVWKEERKKDVST